MPRIALTNAHIVPVSGDPFDGTIVLDEGKIAALGADVDTDGAEVIDLQGQWVTPGLVESHGHVGIDEEGHGWAGQDTNEGTDAVGPRFRALDGIHPTDESFRDALSGGVTTIVVKPGSASPIGGQTVALKSWGRMVDEMVIKQPCSIKSALGENPKRFYGQMQQKAPKTRQGVAAVIRQALMKAQDYVAKRDHAEAEGKPFQRDLDMEVLAQVLSGEVPWCQHCHRVDDITTAIRLADEFGYRLIINHGTEAHLIADYLADRNLPVVIGPLLTGRSKQELSQRSMSNPGRLTRAGIKIAITTDAPVVPINYLALQAELAVREGLDPESALKSITLWAAEIMGLDERVGSLEVGKDADVVVWTGDPLQAASRATQVFIDGRRVYHYDDDLHEGITVDPYVELGRTVTPAETARR